MTSSKAGGCLCGAVRFVAEGVETEHHACHCGMCRRWSGGAPFFGVTVQSVVFSGSELTRYASSKWAERGFLTVAAVRRKPLRGCQDMSQILRNFPNDSVRRRA
jgi:hypothetical protein